MPSISVACPTKIGTRRQHVTTSVERPVALITGGTTGIGSATAQLLHSQGYAVTVTGQNPDTIASAKKELPAEVAVIRADARVLADTKALAEHIRTTHG